MPYKWTARAETRLRKAVSSYNAAITRREKELDNQGLSDYKIGLPARTTIEETKKRIHSKNDYRRIVGYASDEKRGRTSELNRILKKNDPHALDIKITAEGAVTTKYKDEKMKRDERAVDKRRKNAKKNFETSLYKGDKAYDLGNMSSAERAALLNGTDIPNGGEYDPDYDQGYTPQELYDDYARFISNERDTGATTAKLDTWLGVWQDPSNFHSAMPGYDDVVSALKWLAENRIDVLGKMFDEGRDEMQPMYIYIGDNRNPYADIAYVSRHDRAVKYITGVASSVGWSAEDE